MPTNMHANYPQQLTINPDMASTMDHYPMDKLLAKLSEQHHGGGFHGKPDGGRVADDGISPATADFNSVSSSLPITPATDTFTSTAPTTRPASATITENGPVNEEVLRLKLELAQAHNKITHLDQELIKTRMERVGVMLNDTDAALALAPITSAEPLSLGLPTAGTMAPTVFRNSMTRDMNWHVHDDAHSKSGDPMPGMSGGTFNRARAIWNSKAPYNNTINTSNNVPFGEQVQQSPWARGFNNTNGYAEQTLTPTYQAQTPAMDAFRPDRSETELMLRPGGSRRGNRYENRFGSGYGAFDQNQSQFRINGTVSGTVGSTINGTINGGSNAGLGGGMGVGIYNAYQPQPPIGTPLSPHAAEFNAGTTGNNWKTDVSRWRLPF